MRLLELFDKVADWSWDEDHTRTDVATFRIGDRPYYIQFDTETFDTEYLSMFEFEDEWAVICDIVFSMAGKRPGGKRGIDVTGTGHAYEVFATVKDIIDNYVNTHSDVKYLHFEASELSRIKLYDRFVQNYSGRTEQAAVSDDPGGEVSMHYLVKL